MSPATLRTWVLGRSFPSGQGTGHSDRIIQLQDARDPRLSFSNLVEAHVLLAVRKKHAVPMFKVRRALKYAEKEFKLPRLLLREELRAAPGTLFLEQLGKLIEVTQDGQLAMKDILDKYLERLERDVKGLPLRLYPFTRTQEADTPRAVFIDPVISFGRPVVASKAIRTSVIADRFGSGESLGSIADDYGLDVSDVEEAVRYE